MTRSLPAWSLPAEAAAAATLPRAWPEPITREWAIGESRGKGISVCIVDSGVDGTHPLVAPLASAMAVELEGRRARRHPRRGGRRGRPRHRLRGVVRSGRSALPSCTASGTRYRREGELET